MPIRTIVVDDEELGRKRITALLKSEADIEFVAECGDAASASQAIAREKPDLLLLDIQMPGQDGFTVIEAMEEDQRPVVVFVTAYDKYALRAFEAQALDYLLKPFIESASRRLCSAFDPRSLARNGMKLTKGSRR